MWRVLVLYVVTCGTLAREVDHWVDFALTKYRSKHGESIVITEYLQFESHVHSISSHSTRDVLTYPCPIYHEMVMTVCMLLSDINECQENDGSGPCEDKCENNIGSYKCRCIRPGYIVDDDDPHACYRKINQGSLTKFHPICYLGGCCIDPLYSGQDSVTESMIRCP